MFFFLPVVIALILPSALKSQPADCWIPVTENGRHGFIDAAGKLAFPLQPYRLSNVRNGLIVTNDGNGEMQWHERPERVCPTFYSGNSGLMTTRGEWVVPMGDHKIGWWGHGIYWVCKGGQAKLYCTEPRHMEGGSYAFVNEAGMLVDSLDDIALGFVDGHTPVHKRGRIALMDSTGHLATGYDFDKALFQSSLFRREPNGVPDDRLWKLALRREDKWVALQKDGSLLPLDWPAEMEEYGRVGWREPVSPWISRYIPMERTCICESKDISAAYRPRDLTYAENFPSQVRSAEACMEIRAQLLAGLGLKTVEKHGQRALARLDGKRLTDYGPDSFEATCDGFVAVIHTERSYGKEDPMLDAFEDFVPRQDPKDGIYTSIQKRIGLLTPEASTIIPPEYEEIHMHPEANLIGAVNLMQTAFFDFQGRPVCSDKSPSLGEISNGCYIMYFEDHCEIRDTLHHILHQDSFGMQKPFIDGKWLWYYSLYDGHYHGRELKGDSAITYPLDYLSPEILAFKRKHPAYAGDSTFLEPLENGHWRVAKEDRMGICNANGNFILPMQYDYIAWYAGMYELRKGNLKGLADVSGKLLFPVEYTFISLKDCGYFRLGKEVDGKMMTAVMDLNGKTIWGWVPE
jgi:hypothetical protein